MIFRVCKESFSCHFTLVSVKICRPKCRTGQSDGGVYTFQLTLSWGEDRYTDLKPTADPKSLFCTYVQILGGSSFSQCIV